MRNKNLMITVSLLGILMLSACGGISQSASVTNLLDDEAPFSISSLNFNAAVSTSQAKTFRFSWTDQDDATHYRILEDRDGSSGFTQVSPDIPNGTSVFDLQVPLFNRTNARYMLQTCMGSLCINSTIVSISGNLQEAIGYIKASNAESGDIFGDIFGVSLSDDGTTLAVAARFEDSASAGINGDQSDNVINESGAVYIYILDGAFWHQQAYLKSSSPFFNDQFGISLQLSADGNTLAVGASNDNSNATGINGDENNGLAADSGSVDVFTRSGTNWSQQAYIKASNTGTNDSFGKSLSLSSDGNTLVVGAEGEDSNSVGVFGAAGGNQVDNSVSNSGAVYVFSRSGSNWSQSAYIKASNTAANYVFGRRVYVSGDGNTLGVVSDDSSGATGIDGDESDTSASLSGSVHVYTRSGLSWAQQAYIKASNTDANDRFGTSLSFSRDGNILAVGALGESSNARGIGGDQSDNSQIQAGAVYIFNRLGTSWSQQAYIKSSNTGSFDHFSYVSLNSTGNILAVGAVVENSGATGVNGDQSDNSTPGAGATYVFTHDSGVWIQQSYLKAPNTEMRDFFGGPILSGDGNTLAIGAAEEDSSATGIGGDQSDNSQLSSGAMYIY